jgi:hypothetical protein
MKSMIKLFVFSALAGVALGIAVAYVEVRPWAVITVSPDSRPVEPPGPDDTGRDEAEAPETIFNFGHMERGTTMSHAFKIRNIGNRPLRVGVSSTTCKCTVGDLEKNEILPNEETEVLLEWTAKTTAGPFRHGATITTSDPKNSRIELTVEGDVVESSSIIPAELLFGNVRVGKTSEAYVYVSSNLQQDVKVLDYKFSDEKQAEQFDVQITPVDPNVLPHPDAIGGVKVTATFLGGTTIGQFYGWLELTTNLETSEKLSVMVAGSIVGDISIYGPGWIARQGLLRMGSVRSSKGKQVRLNLAIRGDLAQTTELRVADVEPSELKATLGDKLIISDQLVHVPLIVELPQGTPPMVRVGEPASTDAKIVLKSNNPQASEILLRVQFIVEP